MGESSGNGKHMAKISSTHEKIWLRKTRAALWRPPRP